MAKARGSQNGDTPFTFKSRTGVTITIPAKVEFDPDADAMAAYGDAVAAAQEDDSNALFAASAALRFIRSGFPEKVAEKIKLKASEVEDFMVAYGKHRGTDIPKS